MVVSKQAPMSSSFSVITEWIDRKVGRGSYKWLRKYVDPGREYTQLTYGRQIAEIVVRGTRWLDAGCGHQVYDARQLSDETDIVRRAGLVVGCDLVSSSLSKHRSIAHVLSCSLTQLPFQDNAFDLVTLNMVVEHLEHPETVFAEIARVLDSNGLLVVHTPNADGYIVKLIRVGRHILPESIILRMIRYLEYREPEDVFPTFYRANTVERLQKLLVNSGLTEEKTLFLNDKPIFYFVLPLSFIEIVLTRILSRFGWQRRTATVLLGIYRRRAPVTKCSDDNQILVSASSRVLERRRLSTEVMRKADD